MPNIAIIGRQNVGKSALFNALLKKRVSITYDRPGVTRDLIKAEVEWGEGSWTLTDFPGLESLKKLEDKRLEKESIARAHEQLQDFHLLLWVVSVRGLDRYDYELAKVLRRGGQRVWLVVNFVDDESKKYTQDDFYALGFAPLFFISALNKRNINVLRENIQNFFQNTAAPSKADDFVQRKDEQEQKDVIRFSLIGKPNAGKSTLFNSFLQKDIAMISDIPGTTRDSLRESFLYHGKTFVIADTAGMKRRSSLSDSIDFFSQKRSEKATDEADVILYLIDPLEGFDRQNKMLIQSLEKKGKPMILLLNKKDLLEPEQRKKLQEDIEATRRKYWNFPYYFISALEKNKQEKILQKALELKAISEQKISSHRLNELLQALKNHKVLEGQKVKLKYITAKEKKNRLIIFANRSDIPENARRYLKRQLAQDLGWQELPLDIDFRKAPVHEHPSVRQSGRVLTRKKY